MAALTTLTSVKSWVKVDTSTDDTLLNSLIRQISAACLNYLQRPTIVKTTYTEQRNGSGNSSLTLRNWPVTSIASVTVDGVAIQAATSSGKTGYTLSTWDGNSAGAPQQITLNGYAFSRGLNNVVVVYDAGYSISDEAHTIPGISVYTVNVDAPYGNFAQDDGVTHTDGTAFIKVTSNPAQGQ